MKKILILSLFFSFSFTCADEDAADLEKSGRLPRDLLPFHYDLIFRPDINTGEPPFTSTGLVNVSFECYKSTNVLHLNARRLTIRYDSVSFHVLPGQQGTYPNPILTSIDYRPSIDFVSLTVHTPFVEGIKYVLKLEYEGRVGLQQDEGLYWDSHVGLDGSIKYIAATQLQAIEARKAYPCMDEVDMKATFSIAVDKLLDAQVVLSNMPAIQSTRLPDGWTRVTFDTTPTMTTYLVCIVVGHLHKVTAPSANNVNISLYATEDQVKNLEYVRNLAVTKLQKWYDDHTNFPYKEPKTDHVALPSKGGAMENWGLVTYGVERLCVDNETSSVVQKLDAVVLVSHELAHMWYGNLVSCEWWDDVWLQEGFATHFNYIPTEDLGWDWMSLQLSDARRGIRYHMVTDQKLFLSQTVRRTVARPQDSKSAFNSGSYNKGGAVVRMLQGILSRDVFEKALSTFLHKFSYKNANTKDLTDVLDEAAAAAHLSHSDGAPLNFDHILHSWLNIKGFPVLNVSRTNPSTIKISQSLYLRPSGQQVPSSDQTVYSWEVPLSIVTSKSGLEDWEGPVSDWLPYGSKEKSLKVASEAGWYLLNPRQYFYYRLHYDELNIKRLVQQLNADITKILPESRGQLLDDYFEFSRSGRESVEIAMDLTLNADKDFSYNPWQVILKHAHAIEAIVRQEAFFPKFQVYFKRKLEVILQKLSYDFPVDETITTSFLRKDTFSSACSFGSGDCLRVARQEYSRYRLKPDVNSIDANKAPTVLCDGVWSGDQKDYDLVQEQYEKRKTSWVKEERYAYIFAMTCSRDHKNLDSIFEAIVQEKGFFWKDFDQAAQYLASTSHGAERLFKYMDENWKKSTRFNKLATLTTITDKWFNDHHVQKMKDFIQRRENASEVSEPERKHLELNLLQVLDNHAFHKTQVPLLSRWLHRNVNASLGDALSASTEQLAPPTAFHHWRLVEEAFNHELAGKNHWE